ncbi:hypothetical protein [Streptomyces bauhiniae]
MTAHTEYAAAIRVAYDLPGAEGTWDPTCDKPDRGFLPSGAAVVELPGGRKIKIGQRLGDLSAPSGDARVSKVERAPLEEAGITFTREGRIDNGQIPLAELHANYAAAIRVAYDLPGAEGTWDQKYDKPDRGFLPFPKAVVELPGGRKIKIGQRLGELAKPHTSGRMSEGEKAALTMAKILVEQDRIAPGQRIADRVHIDYAAAIRVVYDLPGADGVRGPGYTKPDVGKLPPSKATVTLPGGRSIEIGKRLANLAKPSNPIQASVPELAALEEAKITVTPNGKIVRPGGVKGAANLRIDPRNDDGMGAAGPGPSSLAAAATMSAGTLPAEPYADSMAMDLDTGIADQTTPGRNQLPSPSFLRPSGSQGDSVVAEMVELLKGKKPSVYGRDLAGIRQAVSMAAGQHPVDPRTGQTLQRGTTGERTDVVRQAWTSHAPSGPAQGRNSGPSR